MATLEAAMIIVDKDIIKKNATTVYSKVGIVELKKSEILDVSEKQSASLNAIVCDSKVVDSIDELKKFFGNDVPFVKVVNQGESSYYVATACKATEILAAALWSIGIKNKALEVYISRNHVETQVQGCSILWSAGNQEVGSVQLIMQEQLDEILNYESSSDESESEDKERMREKDRLINNLNIDKQLLEKERDTLKAELKELKKRKADEPNGQGANQKATKRCKKDEDSDHVQKQNLKVSGPWPSIIPLPGDHVSLFQEGMTIEQEGSYPKKIYVERVQTQKGAKYCHYLVVHAGSDCDIGKRGKVRIIQKQIDGEWTETIDCFSKKTFDIFASKGENIGLPRFLTDTDMKEECMFRKDKYYLYTFREPYDRYYSEWRLAKIINRTKTSIVYISQKIGTHDQWNNLPGSNTHVKKEDVVTTYGKEGSLRWDKKQQHTTFSAKVEVYGLAKRHEELSSLRLFQVDDCTDLLNIYVK